jgi:hypothetical protein
MRDVMRIVAAVGAIAATTLVVAACGGGGDGADAGAVAATATATAPVDRKWAKVAPGGDCECADVFNFARADNPFRHYSFIYVPACTGDQHLGDVTRAYSPQLTVEHKGFVNGRTSLSYLADHYPDAAQVVVIDKTSELEKAAGE